MSRHCVIVVLVAFCSTIAVSQDCFDRDPNCRDWVGTRPESCQNTDYIKSNCLRSCGTCGIRTSGPNSRKFDVSRLHPNLVPVQWLVGVWRSEHGGKAIFPTIPKFTYGEQIEFSIPSDQMQSVKALNYTAFAWSINDQEELHSEYGYIAVKPNTRTVSLTTVMNNGFVTVEEGDASTNAIRFNLKDIGRISFSRDLPVHDVIREWVLLDSNTLQARLSMETLTHGLQEHTFIRYNRVF